MRKNHDVLSGLDSGGKVVDDQLLCVLRNLVVGVVVGQDLVVGHQYHNRNAKVLQAHAVLKGAKIVADVKLACRPVAGKDAVFFWIDLNVRLNLAAFF